MLKSGEIINMEQCNFQDVGIRSGIVAGNILYERMFDKCLHAKTTEERVELGRDLNKLWKTRQLYFQMKDYDQLNTNGGTA